VDVVGEVLPDTGHAFHLRLATEVAFGTDFAGDAGDFAGEGVELVDHDVDRVLELADLAVNIDGDFLREITSGDGGRDVRDIANFLRDALPILVDVVGEVLPDARRAFDLRLASELALSTDLAGDTGHLGGEGAQLLHHGVDRAGGAEELAFKRPAVKLELHRLEEIAFGDGPDDPGYSGEVPGVALIELDDAVQLGGDLSHGPVRRDGHTDREVALPKLPQDCQNELGILRGDALTVAP